MKQIYNAKQVYDAIEAYRLVARQPKPKFVIRVIGTIAALMSVIIFALIFGNAHTIIG